MFGKGFCGLLNLLAESLELLPMIISREQHDMKTEGD